MRRCLLEAIVGKGFLMAMVGLSLTACGSGQTPVYPVQGQVLFQGQPASHARVIFHPVDATGELEKIRPHGDVDSKGHFALTTYNRGDGAPAGEYRVTVIWPGPSPGADPKDKEMLFSGPDRLKGRYANPQKTLLKAQVQSGDNQLPAFELQ